MEINKNAWTLVDHRLVFAADPKWYVGLTRSLTRPVAFSVYHDDKLQDTYARLTDAMATLVLLRSELKTLGYP